MNTTDVSHPGTATLAELEEFVDQQEELLGPLVDLGNAGPNSLLTFNMDAAPPAMFVVLRAGTGGVAPAPAGFNLVCQGNCLVNGQLTGVAAFRSAAPRPAVPTVQPGSTLEQALLNELPAALTFKSMIMASAAAAGLHPAVVAAVGSVESGWGTSRLMEPNGPAGTGDRAPRSPRPPLRPGSMPTDGLGFGRGLMQIDWDAHEFARTGAWQDAQANIAFACAKLGDDRQRFAATMQLSPDDSLLAAIAAYNAGFTGASGLIAQQGLKAAFAPGSYGAKVRDRIDFFRLNGFENGAILAIAAAIPGGGPYLATNPAASLGTVVGDGECVAYVRRASSAPNTALWRQGSRVKGDASLASGTAIATFDANGRYGNHEDGRSHAAIYLRQDANGLLVMDQFNHPPTPVHQRPLHFGGSPAVNNGNEFCIIL